MKENWVMYTWQFTENNRPQVITAIMLGIMSMFMGIIPYFGVLKSSIISSMERLQYHIFYCGVLLASSALWQNMSCLGLQQRWPTMQRIRF